MRIYESSRLTSMRYTGLIYSKVWMRSLATSGFRYRTATWNSRLNHMDLGISHEESSLIKWLDQHICIPQNQAPLRGTHPQSWPRSPLVPERKLGAWCGIRAHLLTEYCVLIYLFFEYINYVKYEFHYDISCVYNNSDPIRPHCPLVSRFSLILLLFQSILPTNSHAPAWWSN